MILLQKYTISTHTPLTGCNNCMAELMILWDISTHTPLTGCNTPTIAGKSRIENFYSHTPHGVQHEAIENMASSMKFLLTHPSRGATMLVLLAFSLIWISTHTPLTGCNRQAWMMLFILLNFYSHTPHGVQQ